MSGRNLTLFQCGGLNFTLVSCGVVEVDFVLVSAHGIDSVLELESKQTRLLCAGRNYLFLVGESTDFVLVWVVKIDFISVWGIENDLIQCRGRNCRVLCVGTSKLTSIWALELTWL